jgi:drug/metabolite transporter (DMT)-like permease
MATEVFVLVLITAMVHATWNAALKSGTDRIGQIRMFSWAQVGLSLALVTFVGVPEPASWPYLAGSAVLGTTYMLLLNLAYQAGDYSLVYPLARGIAPLLVAVITAIIIGEHLSRTGQAAVLLIGLGITSLVLSRGAPGQRNARPVAIALVTGSVIAGYTIFDGMGARLAGSTHSYVVWVLLVTSSATILVTQIMARGRRSSVDRRTMWSGLASGLAAYLSSWIIIWACTRAPIALVSALRETSIIFAVLVGVFALKERLSLSRLASVTTTLVGTALLKVGR